MTDPATRRAADPEPDERRGSPPPANLCPECDQRPPAHARGCSAADPDPRR